MLAIAVNGGVTVNDATVIQADVEAENGVIHVIDRVLIPPRRRPQTEGTEMKKLGTAIVIGAAALVAATSISAASPAKTTAKGQKNIVQTAVATGKFKTLVALVKKAGLAGTLSAPGKLTVFAPTDRAFANLKKSDPALYNKVATDKKLLKSVLTYHVVGKRIPAAAAIAAAKKGLKVKTVQGESIALSFKGGKIVLNGTARVVIPDVKASNGVIHGISAVLVPPSLSQPPAPTQSIVQIAAGNWTSRRSPRSSRRPASSRRSQPPARSPSSRRPTRRSRSSRKRRLRPTRPSSPTPRCSRRC